MLKKNPKTVTVAQMREMDRTAIEEFGIPGLILMENAGRTVAEVVFKELGESPEGKKILVFAGTGNNGGDGFVIARHLHNWGVSIQVVLTGKEEKVKGDALTNLNIIKKMKISIQSLDLPKARELCREADLVIDAVFGVGLNADVKGDIHELIHLINESGKNIIAVDVPSGLNADTGEVQGISIKAAKTITMDSIKEGMKRNKGPSAVGEILVTDISIPG